MTDPSGYSDAEVAALYNQMNPWGPSDDFYLPLVMAAGSALDVGCGTGMMLHAARDRGHTGRLLGIDPDRHALAIAAKRDDIEWIEGRAEDLSFDGAFDLAIMISHGFQFITSDDEIRRSLQAIRRALRPGGRFAFETRNPTQRAWETWAAAGRETFTDPGGRTLISWYETDLVGDGLVNLVEVFANPDGTEVRRDQAMMRFLSIEQVRGHLMQAGFAIEEQFGDWDRSPVSDASREIITIARR